MSILYTNAQSIVNKIDELRSVVYDIKPDLVLIDESWTHKKITKAYLNLDGYDLCSRVDREDTADGRGGGLLAYSKSCLTVSEETADTSFVQSTTLKLTTSSAPLNIHLVYRSPNSSIDNNTKLNSFISQVKPKSLVIGDFNHGGIDWTNGTANSSEERKFFAATQDSFLEQHVTFPTHENHILDLVLSSNDIQVEQISDVGNLGKSHHSLLFIKANINPTLIATTQKVPDLAKADFDGLKKELNIDWDKEFATLSAEDMWTLLKGKINTAVEDFIPFKLRRSSHRPLWMNKNIMRIIRKKRRLWNHYKTTKDYLDYQNYMLVQKSVTKTIRDAKRKLERKIAKNMKKNPRQFYSYLSKNTKSRSPVGPLIDSDGTQVSEPQGMCQILNNFFSSVFTNEDITNAPVATSLTQLTVESMTATEEIFKKKLSKIKSNAAPGPDGITAWLLSKLQDVLAKPICMIYNASLSSGEVPSD